MSGSEKFQLDRVCLQEVKRSSYEHTRKCADQLLLLGQTDRAVQLLLETSADNPQYYCDSLKACLVTTVTSSGPSQSTIKLVATNMIANGKLAEGVQLLCLIDKAADACRYLQTYNEWNHAAWLAKVRLNPEECAEVLKRWVDHLCSPHINQKYKAILVLLSLGCFRRVIEMLHSMRCFDRAALFLEACLRCSAIDDHHLLYLNHYSHKLISAVFADYARSLRTLGFSQGALRFALKAGDAGSDLLTLVNPVKTEGTFMSVPGRVRFSDAGAGAVPSAVTAPVVPPQPVDQVMGSPQLPSHSVAAGEYAGLSGDALRGIGAGVLPQWDALIQTMRQVLQSLEKGHRPGPQPPLALDDQLRSGWAAAGGSDLSGVVALPSAAPAGPSGPVVPVPPVAELEPSKGSSDDAAASSGSGLFPGPTLVLNILPFIPMGPISPQEPRYSMNHSAKRFTK
ncbi:WD repeat-containing 11 [Pelobates cultripes]|uniref:WD repeat-containing 11 n=1 Tax=Pelobates cultripes TaxID=61616 RepID=A0AAD1TGN8_PELCU|nr:WD repeat-containing 11 [Pelobates cultripes]